MASHSTAGSLWGLAGCREVLEFTGPESSRTDIAGCRCGRDHLDPDDVRLLVELRVTSPARTAADLLLTRARNEAVLAVDSAVCAGLTSLAEVGASLERRSPHDRRLSAAWAAFRLADASSESPVETMARLRFHDAGLAYRTQVPVRVGDRVRRVDFLVEDVYVETEGVRYHGGREEHERDVRRFNELTMVAAGRPFLRATHDDVFRRWRHLLALIRRTSAMWRSSSGQAV